MATYSYNGYDFDVDHDPTPEEFQQMSAYVDSLPPKEGNDIDEKFSQIGEGIVQAGKNAFGGIESAARMIPNMIGQAPGIADMVAKAYISLAGGSPQVQEEAQRELAATPTPTAHIPPLTEAGGVADEMVGQGFSLAGRTPGALFDALRDSPTLATYKKKVQEQVDNPNAAGANTTEALLALATLKAATRALPKQAASIGQFAKNPLGRKAVANQEAAEYAQVKAAKAAEATRVAEATKNANLNDPNAQRGFFDEGEQLSQARIEQSIREQQQQARSEYEGAIADQTPREQASLFGQPKDVAPESPYAPLLDTEGGASVRNRFEAPIGEQGIDFYRNLDQTEIPFQGEQPVFDPSTTKTEPISSPNAEAVRDFRRNLYREKGIEYAPEEPKGQLGFDFSGSKLGGVGKKQGGAIDFNFRKLPSPKDYDTISDKYLEEAKIFGETRTNATPTHQESLDAAKRFSKTPLFGKSQKGSIGFNKKPPSFEEYSKNLEKAIGEVPDPEIAREMYLKKHGAALTDAKVDEQAKTKAIGAIPGLQQFKEHKYTPPNQAEIFGTPIATRAYDVHPQFGQALQGLEQGIRKLVYKRISGSEDFLLGVSRSDKPIKAQLTDNLLDNDYAAIDKVIANAPKMKASWERFKKDVKEVGDQLVEVGLLEPGQLRKNYIPLIVKDHKGLLDAIGVEKKAALTKLLEDAAIDAKRRGEAFTNVEASEVINKFLRGRPQGSKPGFTKQRVFKEIPEELKKFYASPTETIHTYFERATEKIETAKFFGKNLVKDAETGKIDVNKSIGAKSAELIADGKIDPLAYDEMHAILRARFEGGNRASMSGLQTLRDLTHLTVLTDIANTVTQFGDIKAPLLLAGPLPTLQAIYMVARGKNVGKHISAKELGLLNHISEDFAGQKGTTRAVRASFKANFLSHVDAGVKNINLVANRIKREAEIGDVNSRLYKVYGPRFGDRFPQLLEDLKKEEPTPLTDELLWSELRESQPISKSESPSPILNNPNTLRPVGTLKSFLIKDIDFLVNNAFKEIKRGNVKKGLTFLAGFTALTGGINAVTQDLKDWMTNKPLTYTGKRWSEVPYAIMQSFGVNKYFTNEFIRSPTEAIFSFFAPATPGVLPIWNDLKVGADRAEDLIRGRDVGGDNKKKPFKFESRKVLPVLGDEAFGWSGAGRERRKELEKKERALTAKERKKSSGDLF